MAWLAMDRAYQYPWPPVPEKYLRVGGIATHLFHTGPTTLPDAPPDTSRGRTLLCIHGSGNNGHSFLPLFERLEDDHSLVALSLPGHARSGGTEALGTIAEMAAHAAGVIEGLGLKRPVVLGHSLGGAVVLELALSRPELVGGLVIVGSMPKFPPLPDAALEPLRRVVAGKERRQFRRDAFSPKTPDEIVHKGWMEDAKTDPRVMLGDLLSLRTWAADERLGEVACPTLVLWGEDELPPMLAGSRQLAEGIPGAEQCVVPEAGHMVHFEKPDAVAAALRDFLAGPGGRAS
jgi:pimeloyl-ACP methyl ester carboxylesterase